MPPADRTPADVQPVEEIDHGKGALMPTAEQTPDSQAYRTGYGTIAVDGDWGWRTTIVLQFWMWKHLPRTNPVGQQYCSGWAMPDFCDGVDGAATNAHNGYTIGYTGPSEARMIDRRGSGEWIVKPRTGDGENGFIIRRCGRDGSSRRDRWRRRRSERNRWSPNPRIPGLNEPRDTTGRVMMIPPPRRTPGSTQYWPAGERTERRWPLGMSKNRKPTPQGERAEGDDERAEGPDLADRDPNRSADDLGPCGSAQRPVGALRSTFPDVSGEPDDDSRSTPLHYATPAPTQPSGRRLRGGAPPGAPPEGPGPSVWRTGRGGGRLIPAQEARGGPPPYPEVMLICEELFLLLTKDSGAFESYGGNDQLGLRGAVLLDLVLAGRLSLSPDKHPRLTVLDTSPTGHAALDEALAVLPAKNGKKLSSLINWGGLKPRDAVAAQLQGAGVIERTGGGLFGLATRFPTRDTGPERATRERLYAVLHGERPATHADIALLGILQGMGLAAKVLTPAQTGLGRGELKRTIKGLRAAGGPEDAVAGAVRSIIAGIDAVVLATITAVAAQ